ncbi:MAG: prephenate dehydratase [Cellvibrionaceae bacterium]|jgi:prephenate dehydratase
MPSILYYLGPKHTWSHAAALRAKRLVPAVANTILKPLASADLLFRKIVTDSTAAVIIPTYNLEQGIVYDFARFQLFEEIGTLELKTRMCLFGRVQTVSELQRIYTKDTVLPQVSQWLDALPNHIEIIARPDISTAKGVAMAADEPFAGAICSEAAGHAHQLRPLALGIANNQDNYTAFSVFIKGTQFNQPEFLHSPPEYGFGIDDIINKKRQNGKLLVLWHISGKHNHTLHLGHLSAILSLQALARLGSKIVIQIEEGPHLQFLKTQLAETMGQYNVKFEVAPDRKAIYQPEAIPPSMQAVLEMRADIQGCGRVPGREELQRKLICNHQLLLHAIDATGADTVVAGPSLLPDLKMIAQFTGRIIPTILIDYLPGTDNYAKMSAKRQNQIDWPMMDKIAQANLPSKMLDIHFSTYRLNKDNPLAG